MKKSFFFFFLILVYSFSGYAVVYLSCRKFNTSDGKSCSFSYTAIDQKAADLKAKKLSQQELVNEIKAARARGAKDYDYCEDSTKNRIQQNQEEEQKRKEREEKQKTDQNKI